MYVRFVPTLFILSLLCPIAMHAAGGDLQVNVSPYRIGTVARGAQRVPLLQLKLTASCTESVSLDAVTVVHGGQGHRSDILRIYALEEGKRVSLTTTFGSDNTASVRFRSFAIPACGTRTLTFAVDISSDATALASHQFTIELLSDIATSATVSGNLRASSSLSLAPKKYGVISVTYLDLPRTLSFGKQRIVSRFRLQADSADDHYIHAITLTNDGKAKNVDLKKIALLASNGAILAERASMDGSTLRFVLKKPFLLRKNDNQVFQVRADIQASRRQTIRFLIEEPGDIEASVRTGRLTPRRRGGGGY